MRHVHSIARAALLAVALWAGAVQAAPLKIAVVETLSGPQASTGQAFRAGVRYAIDRMNAAGGWNGESVQLLEYDNQGGPAGASDKLKAAIADGVQIVVQGASSAIGGQITEDVRKHNLRNPARRLSSSTSAPKRSSSPARSATSITSASAATRRCVPRRWSRR